MKLAALKLASLVVLLGGVLVLGLDFGCPYMQSGVETVETTLGGVFGLPIWTKIGGVALVLLGLYAFLPKLSGRAKVRSVTTRLDHGNVITELDPLEAQLANVLAEMAEVKKIQVHLTPDSERRRVRISSDAVLNAGLEIRTRELQERVNRYVAETTTDVFGLEVIQPVTLHVTGVEMDAKAVSKALREREAASSLIPLGGAAEVRMDPIPTVAPETMPLEAAPMTLAEEAVEPVPDEVPPRPPRAYFDLEPEGAPASEDVLKPLEEKYEDAPTAFEALDEEPESPAPSIDKLPEPDEDQAAEPRDNRWSQL